LCQHCALFEGVIIPSVVTSVRFTGCPSKRPVCWTNETFFGVSTTYVALPPQPPPQPPPLRRRRPHATPCRTGGDRRQPCGQPSRARFSRVPLPVPVCGPAGGRLRRGSAVAAPWLRRGCTATPLRPASAKPSTRSIRCAEPRVGGGEGIWRCCGKKGYHLVKQPFPPLRWLLKVTFRSQTNSEIRFFLLFFQYNSCIVTHINVFLW